MVLLSVLRRQLWRCYLFSVDSNGGFIKSNATVMEVLSVLSRQFWWCFLV